MNTRLLLTTVAILLACAGAALLFAPSEILVLAGLESALPFSLLLQMLGGMYLAFASMNWLARGAIIGGIYLRPVSIANFTHFFVGTLVIARDLASREVTLLESAALGFYAVFAISFWWLVFKHPGVPTGQTGGAAQ